MDILDVLLGIWQILTLNVVWVNPEMDGETRERMAQREEMLNREMIRLWQEVEELWRQEQSGFAWASRLLSALQHWQCWAIAGVLVLLLGLCWRLRKRSRETDGEEESMEEEEDEEDYDDANDLGTFLDKRIQKPVHNWDRECEAAKKLVERFIFVFRYVFFNPLHSMLENIIEVGSGFEGWSPREEDISYRLIVPLKPPRGYIFHIERGSVCPTRNFRIRVQLVCTSEMEHPVGETRCFLHNPKDVQNWNKGPDILRDLCTDCYLDVRKISCWFQKMVKLSWRLLSESATQRLRVLPSVRSCKFQVTQGQEKRLLIELIFGVQQGNSDIFLISQSREASCTPSVMWSESYAVAEMKFFRRIASQAQPDSIHLRCLQLCTGSLLHMELSTYALKTVVMHLLNTIPLSDWGSRDFRERLEDILQYLQRCLGERCLKHFFIGNENVPEEIILPQDLRTAEPFNLFQHLEQDPDAHEDAWFEFVALQRRLGRLVPEEY